MQTFARHGIRVGMLLIGAACLVGGTAAGALAASGSAAKTYVGKPTRMGDGTAQIVVEADAAGHPRSIAISLSPEALQGLPTEPNKSSEEGSWEFPLQMPDGPVETGYKEVVIDWNPNGHPPPHVYTVPHFDFHFYGISATEVEKIGFTGPSDPATKVTDTSLVPSDYQVIPDTAVNKMGVHGIDMTAPELHGKPFTMTFIYGYDKGQLIFLEPMVTRAFLLSKPDNTEAVKTPARYSLPGYYPTKYSVRFDKAEDRYLIELGGLRPWPGNPSTSPKS